MNLLSSIIALLAIGSMIPFLLLAFEIFGGAAGWFEVPLF